MARQNQKKKIEVVKKKYNPDIDIVPMSIAGYSLATNNKDVHNANIDFFYDIPRNGKIDRVTLGSYSLSRLMLEELRDVLTDVIKDLDEKAEELKINPPQSSVRKESYTNTEEIK